MRIIIQIALLFLFSQLNAQTFGWKSNPRHSLRLKQIVHDPEYKAKPVPDSASVRSLMPKVYDQEDIGSCTANAGIGAMESAWKRAHGRWLDMSRLDLYQQNLQKDGNFPEDAGSYNSTTMWVLKNSGVSTERLWPYDTSKLPVLPPQKAVDNRRFHTAKTAYDVPNDDGGLAAMRCVAHLKRGVIIGGYVYQSFMQPRFDAASKKIYVPSPSGAPIGGHAILLVSYDRNLVIDGRKGWVEIRNSWSESWGDAGHAWLPMSYVFNPRYMEDFCCIQTTR